MSRYDSLFKAIHKKYLDVKEPRYTTTPIEGFPLPKMYESQFDLYNKIPKGESFCLCSHTGWGKTAFFLTYCTKPTIVIESRKFLQHQISQYRNDFVLYGRSGYHCPLSQDASKTAATAPCLAKEDCDGTSYHATCPNANSTCLNKPCKVFKVGTGFVKYPCQKCDYNDAVMEATRRLRRGETVICNFGNFWPLLKNAEVVVVDEADLFFREISAPMKLKYTKPKDKI